MDPKYDIFLAYAHDDYDAAERIHDALEAVGYRVFWEEDLPIGTPILKLIEELRQARVTMVLWSQTSRDRPRNIYWQGLCRSDFSPTLTFCGRRIVGLKSGLQGGSGQS